MDGTVAAPLVTVITATWRRPEVLLERCVPSVQKQDYSAVEHLIVSDGPDKELAEFLPPLVDGRRSRWFLELPEHEQSQHWGHRARQYGVEYSSGKLITYCDDDDALRPEHCLALARALDDNPNAGFALSRMCSHDVWNHDHILGEGPPSLGSIGTPMIMHRREILEYGTWGPASQSEDWDIVNRWLQAEIPYVQIDDVTSDVWPSTFYSGRA